MPTIADAMLISLGFDTTGLVKGQKEADEAIKKVKESVKKTGADVQKTAAGMTESLGKTSSAFLELMALFMGGVGFKSFVTNAIEADNALSRFSTGLGSSPQLLSAWGTAARNMGGNAATTQASLQGLSDSLVDLRLQGKQLPLAFGQLNAIKSIDISHGWERAATDLAAAANIMAKADPAGANRLLRQLGLDPTTAALLIQQGPRMKQYLELQRKYAPSKADLDVAEALTKSRSKLASAYDLLATKIMTALAPALEWLARAFEKVIMVMAKFVEQHPLITDAIVGMITVMSGAAALKAIATIFRFSTALLGISNIGMGTGLIAWLARGGLWGAIAALDAAGVSDMYEHSSANAGENERARQQKYGRGGGSRPLGGNDAVRRRGRQTYHDTTNYTGSNAEVVRQAAAQLGTTPQDLATVIAYETGGTFSPHIHGGAGGRYQGLIQMGGPERAQYGANDQQTFAQQMPAVVSYLKSRGFKPGMGLLDLYSTINAGRPGLYGASDGNGTVRSHVDRMQREQTGNVRRFLGDAPQHDSWLWKGLPGAGGLASNQIASLSSIANSTSATTSNSSEAHVHGGVHIHVANGSDARTIASHIDSAITDSLLGPHRGRASDPGIA